jgi:Zn-dependent protease
MNNLLTPDKLADGMLWYVVFLFSTTLHEAAHAWSAMKMGDYTAYNGGQVTLNPMPHIRREPIGLVVVPIISFLLGGWMMGWASAPYDPHWALRYPKRAALMALAGPTSNLLLALIAAVIIRLGLAAGVFQPPDSLSFMHLAEATAEGAMMHVATMVSVFFSLNVLLFIFNLLPFPPLDGSSVIPLFLSDNTARKYMTFVYTSGIGVIGFLIVWNFFGYIFRPVYRLAVMLLYL